MKKKEQKSKNIKKLNSSDCKLVKQDKSNISN